MPAEGSLDLTSLDDCPGLPERSDDREARGLGRRTRFAGTVLQKDRQYRSRADGSATRRFESRIENSVISDSGDREGCSCQPPNGPGCSKSKRTVSGLRSLRSDLSAASRVCSNSRSNHGTSRERIASSAHIGFVRRRLDNRARYRTQKADPLQAVGALETERERDFVRSNHGRRSEGQPVKASPGVYFILRHENAGLRPGRGKRSMIVFCHPERRAAQSFASRRRDDKLLFAPTNETSRYAARVTALRPRPPPLLPSQNSTTGPAI